jgi:hypothetical protein
MGLNGGANGDVGSDRTFERGRDMARQDARTGGIGLGGILVIVGIILLIFGHWLLGIIIALIGLIAFGGFAKGKWY